MEPPGTHGSPSERSLLQDSLSHETQQFNSRKVLRVRILVFGGLGLPWRSALLCVPCFFKGASVLRKDRHWLCRERCLAWVLLSDVAVQVRYSPVAFKSLGMLILRVSSVARVDTAHRARQVLRAI